MLLLLLLLLVLLLLPMLSIHFHFFNIFAQPVVDRRKTWIQLFARLLDLAALRIVWTL